MDAYYGEHAYNSQKFHKPTIPPDKIEPLNTAGTHPLPNIILPEKFLLEATDPYYYFYMTPDFIKKSYKIGLKKDIDYEIHKAHELIAFPDVFVNPATIALLFQGLALVLMWVAIAILIIVAIPFLLINHYIALTDKLMVLLSFSTKFIVIPYLVLKLSQWLTHKLPDAGYTIFNRRSGCITVSGKKKQVNLPFIEFDPYVTAYFTATAGLKYSLWYKHKRTGLSVAFEKNTYLMKVIIQHNYLMRFMDISKSLPDVPKLEPYRHLDPVTAELDKKAGRPKDFWKSKTKPEIIAISKGLGKELDKAFPKEFFLA